MKTITVFTILLILGLGANAWFEAFRPTVDRSFKPFRPTVGRSFKPFRPTMDRNDDGKFMMPCKISDIDGLMIK